MSEIIMKRGPTKRCEEKGCMGNPKKLVKAETFNGTICQKCWAVHEFEEIKIQETVKVSEEEKQNKKAEKIKQKTISATDSDIEKLIAEADKKDQKKIKNPAGEQQSLF